MTIATFENELPPGWFIWGDDETGGQLGMVKEICDMFAGVKKKSHECNVAGCHHKPFCCLMNHDREVPPLSLCHAHYMQIKEQIEKGEGMTFPMEW